MNITSTNDIHELMRAHFQSAVLNAALELGLFWRLLDGPQSVRVISQAMHIPPKRCRYWLGMLVGMNLLEKNGDQFTLSSVAHTALDLKGVRSLLDIGGGSGVVSLALLRKHPQPTAVVVDIPNVCTAGREIADTTPERDRITYQPAYFVHVEWVVVLRLYPLSPMVVGLIALVPTPVAFLVTAMVEGRKGPGRLLRRSLVWALIPSFWDGYCRRSGFWQRCHSWLRVD